VDVASSSTGESVPSDSTAKYVNHECMSDGRWTMFAGEEVGVFDSIAN
jgi:hypothetical protein